MKKILSFILTCLLLVCFVACGLQNANATETSISSVGTIPIETTTEVISTETTHIHSYILVENSGCKPTCTNFGIEKYRCSCGLSKTKYIPKIEHDFRETQFNSCITEMVCSRCKKVSGERKEQHQLKIIYGKETTCEEEGYTEYYKCIHCDYTEGKIVLPAKNHEYEVITESNSNGCVTEFEQCKNCKEKKVKKEHNHENTKRLQDKCTFKDICYYCDKEIKSFTVHMFDYIQEGCKHFWYCSRCEGVKNIRYAHGKLVRKNQVETTCTTSGYTGDLYCSNCDMFISPGNFSKPYGHLYMCDYEDNMFYATCIHCSDQKKAETAEELRELIGLR